VTRGRPQAAGAGAAKQETPGGRSLANMAEALKKQALGAHELAGSNPHSMYVEAERRAPAAGCPL
jgi:hypothetical protein